MYVDPRVAHGRASYDLGKNPRMFNEYVELQVEDAIVAPLSMGTCPPRKRDLVRLIERKIVPALNRLGICSMLLVGKSVPDSLLASYVTRSPQHGIRYNHFVFMLDDYKKTEVR
jgi:hypothetical protein